MLKDIDIEIEAIEMRIEQLQREQYGLEKIRDTHRIGVMNYIEQKLKLENEIEHLCDILEDKEQTREDIVERAKDMTDRELRVACMKFGEGKSLKEIAEELGQSYVNIRKISADINKKLEGII